MCKASQSSEYTELTGRVILAVVGVSISSLPTSPELVDFSTSSLFSRISPDLQISPDLPRAGVTRHKKSELSAHLTAPPGHFRIKNPSRALIKWLIPAISAPRRSLGLHGQHPTVRGHARKCCQQVQHKRDRPDVFCQSRSEVLSTGPTQAWPLHDATFHRTGTGKGPCTLTLTAM